MNAWLSFSSTGYIQKPSEHFINLHKLCVYYLRKTGFKNIYFLTDSKSASYFEKIDFSEIFLALDDIPQSYPHVWSLSKLYAFLFISKIKEPFLHIDYDVQLRKPLPQGLLEEKIFVQCPEKCIDYFYELEKFRKNCPFQGCLKNYFGEIAYNMGIYGGTNYSFLEDYASSAIEFVLHPSNRWFWQEYAGYKANWSKAVTAEQYFLAGFADLKNQKISSLFADWPEEKEAVEKGYIHLMAEKNYPKIIEKTKFLIHEFGLED